MRSPERLSAELEALASACIVDDMADSVILGGAPLAGLASRLQPGVPGPLIDPVTVAVGQAITLVGAVESDAAAQASCAARTEAVGGVARTPRTGGRRRSADLSAA